MGSALHAAPEKKKSSLWCFFNSHFVSATFKSGAEKVSSSSRLDVSKDQNIVFQPWKSHNNMGKKRYLREKDTGEKEETQVGHNGEDGEQIRRKEAPRRNEGDAESEKTELNSKNTGLEDMAEKSQCRELGSQNNDDSDCGSTYLDLTEINTKKTEEGRRKEDDAPLNTKEMTNCGEYLDEENKEKEKQKVTPPQRRYYGLRNQGATCYLNSVLQVLFMTPEIHDSLDPNLLTDRMLRDIFEGLKKETCGTEDIVQSLKIKNVHEQGDAAECLESILHVVSPQASEVFKGELIYTTKCTKQHCIIKETNPFWILPQSLKNTHGVVYSVKGGFKRSFKHRYFGQDNMVYCNDCKKETTAMSECEMVKCPQILTLLLKRFDFDYSSMSHVKSDCSVEVPHTLQIQDSEYKLYGMVNHFGSMRGGHYTATILSNEDETWYEFNDTHVKAKEQPFSDSCTFRSKTAYLLVYRANSEGLIKNTLQKQDENSKLDDVTQDKVQHKRNAGERNIDDEEKSKIGQNEEDKVQKERNKAFGHLDTGAADFLQRIWRGFQNTISYRHKRPCVTDNATEQQDETGNMDKPMQAPECQTPTETSLKCLTNEIKEKGEATAEEQKKDTVEDTNEDKNRQMPHSKDNEGDVFRELCLLAEEKEVEKTATECRTSSETIPDDVTDRMEGNFEATIL